MMKKLVKNWKKLSVLCCLSSLITLTALADAQTIPVESGVRPADGNAIAVLNAFIAAHSKTNVAWKGDITLLQPGQNPPYGYQTGKSEHLGYYAYRPLTWAELTDPQREAVMNDDRLQSFIISLRNRGIQSPITATQVAAAPKSSDAPRRPWEHYIIDRSMAEPTASPIPPAPPAEANNADQVISTSEINPSSPGSDDPSATTAQSSEGDPSTIAQEDDTVMAAIPVENNYPRVFISLTPEQLLSIDPLTTRAQTR